MQAILASGTSKRVTAHTFRHAFATGRRECSLLFKTESLHGDQANMRWQSHATTGDLCHHNVAEAANIWCQ